MAQTVGDVLWNRLYQRGGARCSASGRPLVLEVRTVPNVSPLPSNVTLAQAKAFTSTLIKGDPQEAA
jgi:hypothetical protein